MSGLVPPTGTKRGPFVRVGTSYRDKRPLSPPLARLAFGPGTKATYCPGPKGNGTNGLEFELYRNRLLIYNPERNARSKRVVVFEQ